MRAYAVALGTLLTIGYGCVAEVAVQSSSGAQGRGTSVPATPATAAPAPATTIPPSAVWCGGTLAPVIVEARGVARLARPIVTLAGLGGASAALGCRVRNLLGDRAI
jgi:hypothetical protein